MYSKAQRQVWLQDLVLSARRELLALMPAESFGDEDWPPDRAASHPARRGSAKVRALVTKTADLSVASRLQRFVGGAAEMRINPDFPTTMLVIDRDVAVLSEDPRKFWESHFIVRGNTAISALVTVFGHHWADSAAPAVASERQLNRLQRDIVDRLATGATDDAVANELDISSRTVQRHVARIMEKFGVRSRLELGICLAKHELFTAPS
jgi:DNA-binding CsgD family transcriptional regulator